MKQMAKGPYKYGEKKLCICVEPKMSFVKIFVIHAQNIFKNKVNLAFISHISLLIRFSLLKKKKKNTSGNFSLHSISSKVTHINVLHIYITVC